MRQFEALAQLLVIQDSVSLSRPPSSTDVLNRPRQKYRLLVGGRMLSTTYWLTNPSYLLALQAMAELARVMMQLDFGVPLLQRTGELFFSCRNFLARMSSTRRMMMPDQVRRASRLARPR
jgi:hypothetical protein